MTRTFAVMLCVALVGCAAQPVQQPLAIVRVPPSEAMQDCGVLDQPQDGTLAGVYRAAVNAAHRYAECRSRHQQLIDWVDRK